MRSSSGDRGRRRFLSRSLPASIALSALWPDFARAVPITPLQDKLSQWENLGWHWTGTAVQQASADWLAQQASTAGMKCEIQTFPFKQALVDHCFVQDEHHKAIGLPLLNHGETPLAGVSGLLAVPPEAGDIALLVLPPQAHAEEAIAQALHPIANQAPYRAVLIVTTGSVPGLAPLDCDARSQPLPVIQVGSDALGWITDARRAQSSVTVVARVTSGDGLGRNVIAIRQGQDRNAKPVVICTGMSGWGPCTGERGGPLMIWLQIAGMLSAAAPEHSVIMLAADGEELGGLGRTAFTSRFDQLVPNAFAWLELGANLGARDTTLQLQGPASALAGMLERRMKLDGLRFDRRETPPEDVPESTPCRVALHASPAPQFHLPGDRLPGSSDLNTLTSLAAACARAVSELAVG